jgi:Flp pilus assembly secretin CpaC
MKTPVLVAVLTLSSLVPLPAQEAPSPEPPPSPRQEPPAPPKRVSNEALKVLITVARFEGEKKVLSLPNTILVQSNNRNYTKLRMGFEVPVRTSGASLDKEGKVAPGSGSYQYRNVGVNIDCRVSAQEDGRYQLEGNVEQSSLHTPGDRAGAGLPDVPLFRTLSSVINVTLRDGQSATLVAAADPVSGETVRIDVSLSVVR